MKHSCIDQVPAPPGWFVYYFDEEASEVWSLPVALWVLVEGAESASYRAFVVGRTGDVVDYEDTPDEVLCVLPPNFDHKAMVEAMLAKRGIVAAPADAPGPAPARTGPTSNEN